MRNLLVASLGCFLLLPVSDTTLLAQEEGVVLSGAPRPVGRLLFPFETWAYQTLRLANRGEQQADVFVTAYFNEAADQQYGRRMWLPARSVRTSWILMKTPPSVTPENDVEAKDTTTLLLRQQGSLETQVLTKEGERGLSHYVRCSRNTSPTLLLGDILAMEPPRFLEAAQVAAKLPQSHHAYTDEQFPPAVDSYDGLTHVLLSTSRIGTDQAGLEALRHWVFAGGRLWVMLDQVGMKVLQSLLVDGGGMVVIDEVDLTTLAIEAGPGRDPLPAEPPRDFERPVRMVRVVAEGFEELLQVDGWPVALRKPFGDGELLVTTLEPRAWYRPALESDQQLRRDIKLGHPYPTGPCHAVAEAFFQPPDVLLKEPQLDWPALASTEIGYRITSSDTVGSILAAFCLLLLVTGVVQWKRGNLLGMTWIAPSLMGVATLSLLLLGIRSRAAVPPTEASLQFAEFDRAGNVLIRGGLSAYQDAVGTISPRVNEAGSVQFAKAPPGSVKRLVWTDDGARHWENLELPAGIHEFLLQVDQPHAPSAAEVTLDQNGIAGTLTGTAWKHASGAVLAFPSGRFSAVHIESGQQLVSSSADVMPPGQFVSEGVLGDREQLQIEVYKQLFAGKRGVPDQTRFYFWDGPFELDVSLLDDPVHTGEALISLPVNWLRPPSGARYMLPASVISYRSARHPQWGASTIFNNRTRKWNDSVSSETHTSLDCSIPGELLPAKLERISLTIDIHAPKKKLRLLDGNGRELKVWESPVGRLEFSGDFPVLLDGTNPSFRLVLHVSTLLPNEGNALEQSTWRIDDVLLEATAVSVP